MSSSPKTATTTSSSAPWSEQQPYLLRGFSEAENLLNQEQASGGPAYYPGSTVSPYGAETTSALGNISSYAGAGTNANLLSGQAAGLASSGGSGVGGYNGLLSGATGRAGGATLAGIAGQGGAETLAGGATLANTAAGGMLGRNPEFQAMADQAVQAARPSVDAAFASTGRLGSGAHAQAFADSANRAVTGLAYQDYQSERARQEAAAGTLAGLDQNATQQRLGAASTLGQLDLSGYQAAMQGDLSARQLGFQGLGQGQDLAYQNLSAQQGVGQAYDQQSQAYLQDAINRWNWDQNVPREQIANYMSLVNGNYGSQSTTTQPVASSGWMSGAGGLLSGIGAIGGLFK
ncbi:hypothetical protein [Rhodovarius lipocyclicus]|uniref:hypothetical protein n=1 Tax=Rhodovarius lipocyclicus TaxID=268410 RepID=UPI00135B80FA|nr:hypothetical protein [Rhodovarius lipocyclicus]